MKTKEHITYPLTHMQQGLLFEILRHQGFTSFYIVQMIFSIKQKLDIGLFIRAFNIVISRHEILRSAIHLNSEDFNQSHWLIHEAVEIPTTLYDYSTFTLEYQLENFHSFLNEDVKKNIDLSQAPLMRLALFKFNDVDHRIVWTRHHLLMSGAGVELIIRELLVIYFSLFNGKPWSLASPMEYRKIYDYEQHLNFAEAKIFWEKIFYGYTEIGFAPTPLQENKNLTGIRQVSTCLEKEKYRELNLFVTNNQLTINTLLQASLGIVLSSYSGKEQIIFGAVRSYSREVIKNGVGLFINTLPIRIDIDLSKKIIEYLQSVREQNISLKKYVNTPLGKIREWNHLPLDTSLYQCVMDYKPRSLNTLIKEEFKDFDCSISFKLDIPYPLVFEVINERQFLQINLHYDSHLFSEAFSEAILQYFKEILCQLITHPESTLSELPTLTEEEYKKISVWNETDVLYPLNKTIHQLFEEQARKTPSAIALVYETKTLSYQSLNERANQLAHYLIQNKAVPGMRVAICLKSGLEMIIAILATLKARCIYIPIDPHYPLERIKHILHDSQAEIVIIQHEQFNLFEELIGIEKKEKRVLLINMEAPQWSSYPNTNPSLPMKSTGGMYIIYTSGSTGIPKGVLLEHLSIVNTTFACIDRLKITSIDRILQLASFSFDVSVAEWCMTLLSGATLYMINKDLFSPVAIIEALKKYKITAIILASSILAALPHEDLPDLRVIAPGGEPCDQNTIGFWTKNRLFINVYGITETAICSTMAPFDINTRSSIIGKPLANTKIVVLDQQLRPTPIGVSGEIYVGGVGVARGYLNNPAMTEEKFLSKIDKESHFNRFYKTGDQGRWLFNGDLECLGRLDEQVKIRGFRIELAEIERALEAHPAITRAAVAVRQISGSKELYAYFLSNLNEINSDEIRQFLLLTLPHYMIPIQLIKIDKFPLTPNGKIDKQKLIAMEIRETLPSQSNFIDNNTLEQKIIEKMQEILHCNVTDKNKNFLDYGFNSLSLIQFSQELSKLLQHELDVIILFTYPTIKSLAEFLHHQDDMNYSARRKESEYLYSSSKIPKSTRIRFSDED